MKRYSLKSHTADVRIWAEGSDINELFASSLEGLCEVLTGDNTNSKNKTDFIELVNIKSLDTTTLLIDFLSKCLTIMHKNKIIVNDIDIINISVNTISAKVSGYNADQFVEDVKAVTYHEAEIIERNGLFQCMIVLDI